MALSQPNILRTCGYYLLYMYSAHEYAHTRTEEYRFPGNVCCKKMQTTTRAQYPKLATQSAARGLISLRGSVRLRTGVCATPARRLLLQPPRESESDDED